MAGEPEPPTSVGSLTTRIRSIARDEVEAGQLETIMAMVAIAQMLPPGAVKGGAGLKIRLGSGTTRFSQDLDVARSGTLEEFQDVLTNNLRSGWQGFTGRVIKGSKARPRNVPTDYVMQPFTIELLFNGHTWMDIPLEVTHDELELLEEAELILTQDIAVLFTRVGLQAPKQVPVISVRAQVAQKLHAITLENSDRAHDLVDLQLLVDVQTLDFAALKSICIRLFNFRKRQAWPPEINFSQEWKELYLVAATGVDVIPSASEAIQWLQDLIDGIDNA